MTSFAIFDLTTSGPRSLESLEGYFDITARYWYNELNAITPTPIKTRKCTQDDFDSKFFPPAKQDEQVVGMMKSGMVCIDPDPDQDLILSGSIVSKSKFFELGLSRCME